MNATNKTPEQELSSLKKLITALEEEAAAVKKKQNESESRIVKLERQLEQLASQFKSHVNRP